MNCYSAFIIIPMDLKLHRMILGFRLCDAKMRLNSEILNSAFIIKLTDLKLHSMIVDQCLYDCSITDLFVFGHVTQK